MEKILIKTHFEIQQEKPVIIRREKMECPIPPWPEEPTEFKWYRLVDAPTKKVIPGRRLDDVEVAMVIRILSLFLVVPKEQVKPDRPEKRVIPPPQEKPIVIRPDKKVIPAPQPAPIVLRPSKKPIPGNEILPFI